MQSIANNKKTAGSQHPTATRNKNMILRAALGYVQYLNWPVIPLHSIIDGMCTCFNSKCSSQGKHPRVFDGLKAATTDIKTIIEWFTEWPNSNIGIATGSKSGFFALDIDTKHNGHETLNILTKQYGTLPDTVQAITGSGGSHYLFKHHEGIGNKTDLFKGIDIRGEGGYIVASPSIHISGSQYEWELSSHPLETSINEAPKWLLDMIIKPKEERARAKPSSYWTSLLNGVGEGRRNSAAAQLAGHLMRRYINPDIVIEIMYMWNFRNSPPLEEEELHTIINSIARAEYERRERG